MQTCDHQGSLESNAVYQDVAPLAETIIKGNTSYRLHLEQKIRKNLLSQNQNMQAAAYAGCCSMLALGADCSGVICHCTDFARWAS